MFKEFLEEHVEVDEVLASEDLGNEGATFVKQVEGHVEAGNDQLHLDVLVEFVVAGHIRGSVLYDEVSFFSAECF